MKLLLVIVCLTFVRLGSAAAPLPSGNYTIALPAQKSITLPSLDQFLKQQKYKIFNGQGQAALTSLAWLDRVYVIPARKQVLFVKTGLQQTAGIELKTIYRHKHGLLVHLPEDSKKMTALFFEGHSEALVRSLSSQLAVHLRPKKSQAWIHHWLIPTAHAEEVDACRRLQQESQVSPQNADLLQMSWGCLQGLGTGLWDSTVGVVHQVGQGINYVITNGVGGVWDSVHQQFGQMAYIVENFEKVMGEFGAQYEALPADLKAKLICEVITMVGLPVIYAVLSGGASTPAVGVKIAQVVQKFSAIHRGAKLQKFSDDLVKFMRDEQIRLESLFNVEGGRHFRTAMEVRNHALEDLQEAIKKWNQHKSNLPTKGADVPAWARLNSMYEDMVKDKRRDLRAAQNRYTQAEAYLHEMHADAGHALLSKTGSAAFTTSYLCILNGQLSEFFDLPDESQVQQ